MKIWAILGAHRGDNNQVLALAEALGLPYERKQLTYNHLRHLGPRILGATFSSLTPMSRTLILDGEPDVTISTGHRSVPVVQALRKRSNGRIRSVHVNYPRISPAKFDLVVATPEYPIPDQPGLLRIPFALTRIERDPDTNGEFWDTHASPRRLFIVGGPTLYWKLHVKTVLAAVDELLAAAREGGGCLLVIGSPRTPRHVLAAVESRIAHGNVFATICPVGGPPGYKALLAAADMITVTADSVAMVSDAIAANKPVGLVPIFPSALGWIAMRLWDRLRPGRRLPPRDLRFFWRTLELATLVGTVREPRHGVVPHLISIVAARVRTVLKIDDS
jgi:mitochondrial fission protein ELM1